MDGSDLRSLAGRIIFNVDQKMKTEPVAFIWSGREMVPLDRYRTLANRQFRPGREYALIPHRDRSMKAHGLYFKAVEIAWQNLPEHWQLRRDSNLQRFPTSTHLRKWALVQEGYADEHVTPCENHEMAMQVAALARTLDEYSIIVVSDNVVTVWVAQSQDHHNMGHDEFQRSMDKVLSRVSDMLGISTDDLCQNAKASMKRIKENS
jgi:hypothetical protein